MSKRLIILLIVSHLGIGAFGVGLGMYILPILIAPTSPTIAQINDISASASFEATFVKDLADSDAFHWGQGKVYIGTKAISLMGTLAPGPDYKLYLAKQFVETEHAFNQLKPNMIKVGEVNTFENFVVNVPNNIDPSEYNTVIVWCERFGEFITAAKYQ